MPFWKKIDVNFNGAYLEICPFNESKVINDDDHNMILWSPESKTVISPFLANVKIQFLAQDICV